jgi:hypothetical protein
MGALLARPDHCLPLAPVAAANRGAARAERSEPKVLEPQEFLSDRGRVWSRSSNQTFIACRRPARVEVGDDADLVAQATVPSTRKELRGTTGGDSCFRVA